MVEELEKQFERLLMEESYEASVEFAKAFKVLAQALRRAVPEETLSDLKPVEIFLIAGAAAQQEYVRTGRFIESFLKNLMRLKVSRDRLGRREMIELAKSISIPTVTRKESAVVRLFRRLGLVR